MNTFSASPRTLRVAAMAVVPLLLMGSPALAHHPFGMGDSGTLTAWQGLLSGIGHPLLGPDHLLFLLAIAFVGLKRPMRWVVPKRSCYRGVDIPCCPSSPTRCWMHLPNSS